MNLVFRRRVNGISLLFFAECFVNEYSHVSSVNGHVLADNLTQNIHTTAIIGKHQVTTEEEAQNAEKAKSPLKCLLFVDEQPIDGNISTKSKTVVFPRNLNRPIPARASVMPYSDGRWVAYKVPALTA